MSMSNCVQYAGYIGIGIFSSSIHTIELLKSFNWNQATNKRMFYFLLLRFRLLLFFISILFFFFIKQTLKKITIVLLLIAFHRHTKVDTYSTSILGCFLYARLVIRFFEFLSTFLLLRALFSLVFFFLIQFTLIYFTWLGLPNLLRYFLFCFDWLRSMTINIFGVP